MRKGASHALRSSIPARALIAALVVGGALAPAAANAHPGVRSDAVTAWNANAGEAAIAACISPRDGDPAAGTDGNPDTRADPTWTPLVTTPPIPDYDSAHAVEGGAASKVLKRIFGNHTTFETCSLTLPDGSKCTDPAPVLRRYRSFSGAAAENAVARILVGFHFRRAVEEGVEHGGRIGDHAVDHFLRPAHDHRHRD